MFRRFAATFVVAIFLLPSVAAQDESDPLSPEERAWLEAHGPILYAPDPGYPPFEFLEGNGTASGINVDFLNRISRNLGIEIETVVYDNWTVILEAMERGEIDLLGSLAKTDERDVYMDFSPPYMAVGEVYYVTIDRTDLQTEADLTGKRVAVVGSYAAADWLAENRPEVVQVPVENIQEGLDALSTGQVDAFFENVPVTGYFIRQSALTNIRILGEPLYYSDSNWGVQEGNDMLLSIMQKGMDSVPLGEQTKIFEYWTGYDLGIQRADAEVPLISPVGWGILAVVSLAALLGVGFSWTLRRQVNARTAELEDSRDELRGAMAELETRVDERTHELRSLTGRFKEVNEALAGAATAADKAVEEVAWDMRNRYHGILKPESRHMLDLAVQNTSALGDLVEDLGHLTADTKLARGTVRLDRAFFSEAENVQKRRDRAVQVTAKPIEVAGDTAALARMARKFILHALEVSPGDAVALEVGFEQGADKPIFIRYAATPEVLNDLDSIAEPLGLAGLAVQAASRIVHRHRGDITWEVSDDKLCARFNLAAPEST